jgi:hypothetical protein
MYARCPGSVGPEAAAQVFTRGQYADIRHKLPPLTGCFWPKADCHFGDFCDD